jgi:hypothetical protein
MALLPPELWAWFVGLLAAGAISGGAEVPMIAESRLAAASSDETTLWNGLLTSLIGGAAGGGGTSGL